MQPCASGGVVVAAVTIVVVVFVEVVVDFVVEIGEDGVTVI